MQMFKNFYLKDIFGDKPIRGTRLTKENRISGNIPLVTAGEQNEGIAEYISNSENQTLSNMLTIDMFGNCFYRDYLYKSDDNILSFGLNGKSTEEMLYIASTINSIVPFYKSVSICLNLNLLIQNASYRILIAFCNQSNLFSIRLVAIYEPVIVLFQLFICTIRIIESSFNVRTM